MKAVILCVVTLMLAAFAARAQNYTIDWYKVAAGGGTSTNGSFQVTGTIGQHDAGGPMMGGEYSLTGGFWSLISVLQTVGAPVLTVTHLGNSVVISWPVPSAGFMLQQNANLATTNWMASGFAVSTNGAIQSITIPSPSGQLFFRLAR